MGERRYVLPVEFVIFESGSYCRDLLTLVACARAGARAWAELPTSGAVDVALLPRKVQEVLDTCDELEAAWSHRRVEVEEEFAQQSRDARRGATSMLTTETEQP